MRSGRSDRQSNANEKAARYDIGSPHGDGRRQKAAHAIEKERGHQVTDKRNDHRKNDNGDDVGGDHPRRIEKAGKNTHIEQRRLWIRMTAIPAMNPAGIPGRVNRLSLSIDPSA